MLLSKVLVSFRYYVSWTLAIYQDLYVVYSVLVSFRYYYKSMKSLQVLTLSFSFFSLLH